MVFKKLNLNGKYYAEGIVVWKQLLILLTWKSGVGFVYNVDTFNQLMSFSIPKEIGEGWGITHDGNKLIVSNGTGRLYFLDPNTFKVTHKISVSNKYGKPVTYLNELEYCHGEVFANVWYQDIILRIDPQSGNVIGQYDFSNIYKSKKIHNGNDVLNGIAFDKTNNRLFITGKLWDLLYEVELIP